MSETFLTVAEVASRLKCHPHTIRRWIWDCKLRAVRVGDLIRVSENEVARLVRPVARKGARKERRQSLKGATALLYTMSKLRQKVKPADVELMERMIASANLAADWENPLG